ncbi:hypothetical protein IW492_14000 [Enterococcus sp. BWB1-3]|uniref:hypothetical protein n=1 Tax=unclassified Enterococcus TaxID=2608891 RepID=UPI0019246459|nr:MULTISPECIES: hypothetical protein [unclassified Enterococcus]MBL1230345.1 hypothetical protein [Enterococcus sp. BWB1-3]MCB5955133.1 hypothetical protein [Enterococcus sp. CWB-B31]
MEINEKDFLLEKARQAADSLGAFLDQEQEATGGLAKSNDSRIKKTILRKPQEDMVHLRAERKKLL